MGLVLNALLAAKCIEPAPALAMVEPKHLAAPGQLKLKEGARLGEPLLVRALG